MRLRFWRRNQSSNPQTAPSDEASCSPCTRGKVLSAGMSSLSLEKQEQMKSQNGFQEPIRRPSRQQPGGLPRSMSQLSLEDPVSRGQAPFELSGDTAAAFDGNEPFQPPTSTALPSTHQYMSYRDFPAPSTSTPSTSRRSSTSTLSGSSIHSQPDVDAISIDSEIAYPNSSATTTQTLDIPPSDPSIRPLKFPLPAPPLCRYCQTPATGPRPTVSNANGNAGRPVYRCAEGHGIVCFDDDIGIDWTNNRSCFCAGDHPVRQGRRRGGGGSVGESGGYVTGRSQGHNRQGAGFWACATGGCGFESYRADQLTNGEARELGVKVWADEWEPWLLPFM